MPTNPLRDPSERLEAAYRERDEAMAVLRHELELLREAVADVADLRGRARRPRLEVVKGGKDG